MSYVHDNSQLRKHLLRVKRKFSQESTLNNSTRHLLSSERNKGINFTEDQILWLGYNTEKFGSVSIFRKLSGKIASKNTTIFESIKTISPKLLQKPSIHIETRALIDAYLHKHTSADLNTILKRLRVGDDLSRLVLDSARKEQDPQHINSLIRALILWFKGFRHIQSKRLEAKMLPKRELLYINFLKNSNGKRPAHVAYYFTLYKSSNPLRTAHSSKIDLAELEFFRTQIYPGLIGDAVGIPVRWIVINEANETGILDGVSAGVINYNYKTVKKYLKLLDADQFFDFRSIRSDIRKYLDNFSELYSGALKIVNVSEAHIRNFIFFPSPSYFRSKGISKKTINKILISAVSGKLVDLPKNIYSIAYDNAQVLMAIKAVKVIVQENNLIDISKAPPQYREDIIDATLIRDPNRFSIRSQSDFAGKSRLPNYGMAIYCSGEYLGELYFWEVISNIDLFKAHIVGQRIVAFELLLDHKSNRNQQTKDYLG